jgi:hypothetical protein
MTSSFIAVSIYVCQQLEGHTTCLAQSSITVNSVSIVLYVAHVHSLFKLFVMATEGHR